MQIEIHKRVKCKKAIKKAMDMLQQLEAGTVRARRTHGKKFRVLEFGGSEYRLLERTEGVWELVNHSVYNKIVDKHRKCTVDKSAKGWA